MTYHFTHEEHGKWTYAATGPTACPSCAIKHDCTTGKQRRIPDGSTSMCWTRFSAGSTSIRRSMRQRRETVEHPFGTIKARMGATHFLMKTLPRVAAEMALHVLAYNLTRVMNIVGVKPLMAAIGA